MTLRWDMHSITDIIVRYSTDIQLQITVGTFDRRFILVTTRRASERPIRSAVNYMRVSRDETNASSFLPHGKSQQVYTTFSGRSSSYHRESIGSCLLLTIPKSSGHFKYELVA